VRILGASFDTIEDNRAFAENEGFRFPLLCDFERRVGPLYGAARPADDPYPQYARRVTYVIDPEGTVLKTYEVTDIDQHLNELLVDVRNLIEGQPADVI
jgi:peroxiredoxin Q/BCP